MKTSLLAGLLLALCMAPVFAKEKHPVEIGKPLPALFQRLVLVSDSITDGLTYPLLLQQSFFQAGFREPAIINAGVGGDNIQGMSDRLERDVVAHHPSLVLLNSGVNDADVLAPEDYEKIFVAIIEKLKAHQIPLMIVTTTMTSPPMSEADLKNLTQAGRESFEQLDRNPNNFYGRMTAYRAIQHRLAAQYNLPVADVYEEMKKSSDGGDDLWEEGGGAHLNFAGYRAFVRAVLDGMGYDKITVPTTARIAPSPGILPEWKTRAVPETEPRLNEKTVAALSLASADWVAFSLPLKRPQTNWYWNQLQSRGYAVDLDKIVPGKNFISQSKFHIRKAQSLFFNSGSGARSVWLLGPDKIWKQVWSHDKAPQGWHLSAGGQFQLPRGDYQLLVESGSGFFLSITPDDSL